MSAIQVQQRRVEGIPDVRGCEEPFIVLETKLPKELIDLWNQKREAISFDVHGAIISALSSLLPPDLLLNTGTGVAFDNKTNPASIDSVTVNMNLDKDTPNETIDSIAQQFAQAVDTCVNHFMKENEPPKHPLANGFGALKRGIGLVLVGAGFTETGINLIKRNS